MSVQITIRGVPQEVRDELSSLPYTLCAMTPAEIAAYIGAAAWLPQIASLLYRWLRKPVLTIVPEPAPELGFTSNGIICNLRLAFIAEREDLILDDLALDVVHEDGEQRVLRWAGANEDLGETAGVKQGQLTKEHPLTALGVATVGPMTERFVLFREPRYRDETDSLMQDLVAHFDHLKRTETDYVNLTLSSKELHSLIEARTQFFWWKPGHYKITFRPVELIKSFSIKQPSYSFELKPSQVERLRQNLAVVRRDLEDTIRTNIPDFRREVLTWNWVYPELKKS